MHDKLKNWSEGHGSYEDMTQGVGSFSDDDDVSAMIVKRGVIPMSNCDNCGRQWKGLVTWGEIAQFYMQQPVTGTQITRSGVLTKLKCRGCSKDFVMIMTYPEINQWVDAGVGNGMLDARIRQARRR